MCIYIYDPAHVILERSCHELLVLIIRARAMIVWGEIGTGGAVKERREVASGIPHPRNVKTPKLEENC